MATATKPKLPDNLSESQYEQIFANAGKYEGNDKAYKGKSWGDVYHAIWVANVKQNAHLTPYQVALKVEILITLQGGVDSLTTAIGNFINQTDKAAASTNFAAGVPNPLQGVLSFLGIFTTQNLWVRVAKVTIGGTILIVGLAKLTGADKQIGGIASKAVKAAPLL